MNDMCDYKEGSLLPQRSRKLRGSASGGGIVPAPPSSRGYDPKSCHGLHMEDSSEEEFPTAENWNKAAELLGRLIRLLEIREEKRGISLPYPYPDSNAQFCGKDLAYKTCQCRKDNISPDSGRESGLSEGKAEAVGSILESRSIGIQTEETTLAGFKVNRVKPPEDRRGKTGTKSWADAVRYGCTFERSVGASNNAATHLEENKVKESKDCTVKCYWCRASGHTRSKCPVTVNMSNRCYWCGTLGHRAAACAARPFCWPCSIRGRQDTCHAAGGRGCPEYPPSSLGSSGVAVEAPHSSTSEDGRVAGATSCLGKKKKDIDQTSEEETQELSNKQGKKNLQEGNGILDRGILTSPPVKTGGGPGGPVSQKAVIGKQEEDRTWNRGTLTSPPIKAEGGPGDSTSQDDDSRKQKKEKNLQENKINKQGSKEKRKKEIPKRKEGKNRDQKDEDNAHKEEECILCKYVEDEKTGLEPQFPLDDEDIEACYDPIALEILLDKSLIYAKSLNRGTPTEEEREGAKTFQDLAEVQFRHLKCLLLGKTEHINNATSREARPPDSAYS